MEDGSAALAVAASDRNALDFSASSFAPSPTFATNMVSEESPLVEPAPTTAFYALLAVGALVSAVGILLDCVTLHVLRSVRFSGRAATAPAVRLSLVSLCCADVLLAVGTLLVCASHFAEQAEMSKRREPSIRAAAYNDSSLEAAYNDSSLAAAYNDSSLAAAFNDSSRAEASGAVRRAYCLQAWATDLWSAGVHANLFTLLVMASEQAAAVRWPFASERLLSARRFALALAASWLCSLAIGLVLPMAAVATKVRHPDVNKYTSKGVSMLCYQRILYGVKNSTQYVSAFGQAELDLSQVGIGIGLMFITFACLTIGYGYMFCVVRRIVSSDRKLSRRPAASSSSSVATGGGGTPSAAWRGSRRMVTATFSVAALFLASYAPLFVYNAWRLFNETPADDWLYAALFAITSVTSVCDPLVYAWRLKEVRLGFHHLFRRCQSGRLRRSSSGSRACSGGKEGAVQRARRGERDAVYRNALAAPLLPPPLRRGDGSTVPSASAPHSQTSVEGTTLATFVAL